MPSRTSKNIGFVARGDAPELLQAVDEGLDPVADALRLAVEARPTPLALLGRDDRPDPAPAQLRARAVRQRLCRPQRDGAAGGRPCLRQTAPVSRRWCRPVLSCRSPPVRWKVTGLPQPSAHSCPLVQWLAMIIPQSPSAFLAR